MLYRVHLAWAGFELATLVAINYHMMTATTTPFIVFTVKPTHPITFIKQSPVSKGHILCLVSDNAIWIEPVLRGNLSYKVTFPLPQKWLLNTGLTIFYIHFMHVIIHVSSIVSALARFIVYIYYWNWQFPSNVIIIKTKVLLPQAYVTLSDFIFIGLLALKGT
jgi:hypothetical protein